MQACQCPPPHQYNKYNQRNIKTKEIVRVTHTYFAVGTPSWSPVNLDQDTLKDYSSEGIVADCDISDVGLETIDPMGMGTTNRGEKRSSTRKTCPFARMDNNVD